MPEDGAAPLRHAREGLLLDLRVHPKAAQDAFTGVTIRSGDRPRLGVRVRSAPVEGAANVAVCRLVAEALGVARTRVCLVSGDKSRDKTLVVPVDEDLVRAWLRSWQGGDALGRAFSPRVSCCSFPPALRVLRRRASSVPGGTPTMRRSFKWSR
ncbi:MAG: DUF167 domain-containing protein [Candidatus Sericytochromatia bacterium]|nr:DUF167 domain-containing protein [Candidatus Tanganyikabacteria bacterium]